MEKNPKEWGVLSMPPKGVPLDSVHPFLIRVRSITHPVELLVLYVRGGKKEGTRCIF